MKGQIIKLVTGLVLIILGLALAPAAISNAITAATTTGIGSFAGVSAIIDLVPLIFVAGVLFVGVRTLIGSGGRG